MACAIEYPQFTSAISTTGVTVNFDTLYQKANQLNMIHDIKDQDSKHIILAYKDTGNWAVAEDDGTLVIATLSASSFRCKGRINRDLYGAKNLMASIPVAVIMNYMSSKLGSMIQDKHLVPWKDCAPLIGNQLPSFLFILPS